MSEENNVLEEATRQNLGGRIAEAGREIISGERPVSDLIPAGLSGIVAEEIVESVRDRISGGQEAQGEQSPSQAGQKAVTNDKTPPM